MGDNVSKPKFILRWQFVERLVRIRVDKMDIQASDEDSILIVVKTSLYVMKLDRPYYFDYALNAIIKGVGRSWTKA